MQLFLIYFCHYVFNNYQVIRIRRLDCKLITNRLYDPNEYCYTVEAINAIIVHLLNIIYLNIGKTINNLHNRNNQRKSMFKSYTNI